MKVLGLDLETTGLDTSTARIIEVGAVVWDTVDKAPLQLYSEFVLQNEALPLADDISKLTGIKEEWLIHYGIPIHTMFTELGEILRSHDIKVIVAHNGENYDKPLFLAEYTRHASSAADNIFSSMHWVDTRTDLPFEKEPESRRLKHLALDHGFINPFEHRAVFDVLTMCTVMSKYDFGQILENSKIPWIVVRAMTDYDNRQKAKDARFSWEMIGNDKYPKWWVKRIRENQFEQEKEKADKAGFEIVRV